MTHLKPTQGRREDGLIYFNTNAIVHPRPIVMHDAMSFFKCCESLEFLIRDVAHITPHNFPACVRAVRTFVEASFVGRPDGGANRHLQSQNAGWLHRIVHHYH